MITKIRQLVNPQYYSKHSEVKPGATAAKFLGQIISGLTAYYALQQFTGIDNIYLRTAVAAMLALLPELIILYFGWGAMLPIVEKVGNTKAYEIEGAVKVLSTWTNAVKMIVFFFAFATTTFFTFKGSYQYGYDRQAPGEQPSQAALFKAYQAEYKSEYDLRNAGNGEDQERLRIDLEKERQQYFENKTFADSILSLPQNKQSAIPGAVRKAKDFKTGRPWYNLQPGEAVALERIKSLEAQLAESEAATKALFAERDQKAQQAATMDFKEQNEAYISKDADARSSGGNILFVGLFAQLLVLVSLFIIVMVDVGSGTVKDRQRHALDGVNVFTERCKVIYYRWKQRRLISIAELSKRELSVKLKTAKAKYNRKLIPATDVSLTEIFYLESNRKNGTQNGNHYRPAAPKITAKISSPFNVHEKTAKDYTKFNLQKQIRKFKKRLAGHKQKAAAQQRKKGYVTNRTETAIRNNEEKVKQLEAQLEALNANVENMKFT
jgi:hypothetical protein